MDKTDAYELKNSLVPDRIHQRKLWDKHRRGSGPLAEALEAVTGKAPPGFLRGISREDELPDDLRHELTQWASDNANDRFVTAFATLDAAAGVVEVFFPPPSRSNPKRSEP